MAKISLTQELTSLLEQKNKILTSLNVSIPLIPRKEQVFEDVVPLRGVDRNDVKTGGFGFLLGRDVSCFVEFVHRKRTQSFKQSCVFFAVRFRLRIAPINTTSPSVNEAPTRPAMDVSIRRGSCSGPLSFTKA